MFIPVSLASGVTSVDVTVETSGVLNAACEVTYASQTYAPNTDIPVSINTVVRLTTTITGAAEIPVLFSGKLYYWHVALPRSVRYVTDLAQRRISGSVYGSIHKLESNSEIAFVETGTVTKSVDLIGAIFSVTKEVWFFGEGTAKKIVAPETPIDVVFSPRWSLEDDVETSAFLVTKTSLYRLDAQMDIELPAVATFPSEAFDACGYTGGVVIACQNSVMQFQAFSNLLVELSSAGANAIETTHTGDFIVGRPVGTISRLSAAGTTETVLYTTRLDSEGTARNTSSVFQLTVDHPTIVYAIDMANRLVISISGDTITRYHLDQVPSSIAVINRVEPIVGFFDSVMLRRYSEDLSTFTEVSDVKAVGVAHWQETLTTNLYSNAAQVTSPEPTAQQLVSLLDYPIGAELESTFTITWPRPTYMKVVSNAVVQVNGVAFTEGYLWNGDEVRVTLPAEDEYYTNNQVTLVGDRSLIVRFRTEPKLFPDVETVPSVPEAFIRQEYTEQITVSGLTEDFSVEILSNSEELTFSINGGERVTSGSVKNGDVVDLYVTIKNLISKRNLHEVVTVNDALLVAWQVLVMTLNGVTVRQDVVQKKDKYPVVEHSPISSLYASMEGSASSYNFQSTDGYAPAMLQNTTINATLGAVVCDGNAPCEGAVESFLYSPTLLMQDSSLSHYVPFNHTETFEGAVLRFTVNTISASLPVYDASVVYGLRGLMGDTSWKVYTDLATFGDVDVTYAKKSEASYDVVSINGVKRGDITFAEGEWLAAKPVLQTTSTQDGVYEVSTYGTIDAELEREYATPVDGTIGENGLLGEKRYQSSQAFEELVGLRMSGPSIGEMGLTALWGSATRREYSQYQTGVIFHKVSQRFVSASYDRRGSIQPAYQDIYVGTTQPSSVFTDANIAKAHTSRSVEVDLPVAEWKVQSADATLSAEASGYRDLELEAEQDAATLNLTGAAISMNQHEGKFYFLSYPNTENPMCSIVPLPPLLQRRYGYISGG